MGSTLLIYCIIIFAATFGIGLLTLIRKWEDEPLHLFVSFGAGIFMGVVFFHMLPEAFNSQAAGATPVMLLSGFLLVFFVEKFMLTTGDGGVVHEHKAIAVTALIGLTVHSVIEGFGLTIASSDSHFIDLFFYSILSHKIPAAISLASLFLLARLTKKQVVLLLLVFSLATPAGALFSLPFFAQSGSVYIGYMTALTAGSLLYIATGELLPEVFHTRSQRWLKLGLFLAGLVLITVLGPSHSQ